MIELEIKIKIIKLFFLIISFFSFYEGRVMTMEIDDDKDRKKTIVEE